MGTTFQKKVEDFTCEHCGVNIIGNGFTNHCPKCLWSKHVDVHPGDRAEECGGLMRPIGITIKRNETMLIHKCERCGAMRKNRTETNDDKELIFALSAKPYQLN